MTPRRPGPARALSLAVLLLAGCVTTTSEPDTTGVELGKSTTSISTAANANSPFLVTGADGTVQVFWSEFNLIQRKVSTDGGETFGPAEALVDVTNLGNIVAGPGQPRPVAAVVDALGETHLLIQVGTPEDTQRSDIFYTHVETYDQSTDKAVVTGGRDFSGQEQPSLNVYDGRTQQWEPILRAALGTGLTCDAGLPSPADATPRWGHATASVGGLVYAAGGEDTGGILDLMQVYDPDHLAWLTDTPLPAPRSGLALVEAGGWLFAIGGKDGAGALASMLRFDPSARVGYSFDASGAVTGCTPAAANPWSLQGPVLALGRTRPAAVTVNRDSGEVEVHVIGGETAGGIPLTTVDSFRLAANNTLSTIPTLPPLPSPRSGHQAVAVGERIFVLGGTLDGSTPLDTVLTIDLAAASPAWRTVAPMPGPRTGHTAVVLDGEIHVMGGTDGEDTLALVDVYDPDTDTWRTDPESAVSGMAVEGAAAVIREPSLPRNLSRQMANASQPVLTRDPDSGDLYAAWRNEAEVTFGQFETRVTSDVYLSRSADGGATFLEAPVRLSGLGALSSRNNNFSGSPRVAVGPSNLIHLAWIETGEPGDTNGAGQDLIYTNCLPAAPPPAGAENGIDCGETLLFFGSVRGDPSTDSPSGSMRSPSLAVDETGGVYLAWIDRDGTVPLATASANRTAALNVYFSRRRSTGTFTPAAPIGLALGTRTDELFPPGTVADPVAEVAKIVVRVDLPTLVAYGDGEVNVLWTNDREIRMRRSPDGGRTFLTEVGAANLASGATRISPDLIYDGLTGRMLALWQTLTNGATESLVETRTVEPR